ncbi:Delta-60 repeat [Burkholderiaceae bacterium]
MSIIKVIHVAGGEIPVQILTEGADLYTLGIDREQADQSGVIRKYDIQGELNVDFGIDGSILLDFKPMAAAYMDGGIVVAGLKSKELEIRKFDFNGKLIESANASLFVVNSISPAEIEITEDKIFVLGSTFYPLYDIYAYSFNASGVVNANLSIDGYVDITSGVDYYSDFKVQLDGKLIFASSGGIKSGRTIFANQMISISRINSNGSLDETWGANGLVTISDPSGRGSSFMTPIKIALQNDGKVLVALSVSHSQNQNDLITIYRLNSDGGIDFRFGINGCSVIPIGSTYIFNKTEGLEVLSDGRIVVAGTHGSSDYNIGIAVLLPDGTLDKNFGDQGTKIFDANNHSDDSLSSMVVNNNSLYMYGGANLNSYIAVGSLVEINNAPVVTAETITTDEDTAKTGTLAGTDVDGNTLTFAKVADPSHGTVTINATTGAYTYTPNANYNGSDSFTFKVNDGTVDSAVATVSISVAAVNDAPLATAASASTDEDTVKTGTLAGTDVDGNTLTFAKVGDPSHGTVSINATTGAYTYTPVGNYNGSDSFTFKVNDGTVDSAVATVSITVAAVNDAPLATAASASTDEDTVKTGTLAGTDVDGNTLTFAKVGDPSHGTVSINATTGAYTYTPVGNYNGSDSFTFKVNDGTVDSAVATVSISVAAVNDAPLATAASASTDEDTAKTGTLTGTDVEGNTLTFAKIADPSHGTVSINASTGAYTYTPVGNYNGSDSFTFKVNDGTVDSAVATVSITVAAENDAPVATVTTITTDEDTAKTGTLAGTDVDGNTLTFAKVGDPSHGTVSINASTGAYTYTPNANYNGSDSFTFKVNDGTVDSAVATVSITVAAVNDAPVATTASASTDEDTVKTGTLAGTDVDGNTLTFAKVGDPSHGTVSINASTGAYTYTPVGNYNGSDSFTFKVNDGTVDSAVATVSINIKKNPSTDISGHIYHWKNHSLLD